MIGSQKLYIPLFVPLPKRVTYYSLSLRPEEIKSWELLNAAETGNLMLSPALRPCDFRNYKHIKLLDKHLAEELASYVEPVMQKRYGAETLVNVVEGATVEAEAKSIPFDQHREKAQQLLARYAAKNAPRSKVSKVLPVADVVDLQ
ncbi:hypothetical protein AX279_00160 [Pseudomonas sp. J237]|nr:MULTISPECIES: hypothetical protein [Pseudomonas]OEO27855.1 hypothetical protein AX279_00160 [Pseudomonas sp. J237]